MWPRTPRTGWTCARFLCTPVITIFCVFCCLLVSAEIVHAQPWDRVVNFHSEVSVAIDRTLTVHEKIEIDNASGEEFGDGMRRLIPIRPAGDYRAKQNSVEAVSAKVDSDEGAIEVSEGTQYIDIHVRPKTGAWSRGIHTVELNYVVKHQFGIDDHSEALHWDVAGPEVWFATLEKADVELVLPDGWPPGSSLSAEACAWHGDKHDCVRTDLPLGGKFESTEPIDPRTTVVVTAQFSKRGRFVSNVKEDGLRAVYENHPRLKPTPWGMFIAGFLVLITIGFAVLQIPAVRNARLSSHATASFVSIIATVLSGVSIGVIGPYAAMPGLGVGAIVMFIAAGGNAHTGSPLIWLITAVVTNLVFYYFVALGIRVLWQRFSSRETKRQV